MTSTPQDVPEDMQQRLDEVGESIDRARERAEADGFLPEDEPDERKPTLADPDPDPDPDPDRRRDDEVSGDATG